MSAGAGLGERPDSLANQSLHGALLRLGFEGPAEIALFLILAAVVTVVVHAARRDPSARRAHHAEKLLSDVCNWQIILKWIQSLYAYQNLIKPAVEAAGVECIRADEITHAGVIDVPMYERILAADLVVADISTGNRNAIYELGVRHALRPHTTIIIGEDSNPKIPFDLNHIVIRKYRHLGEDIGASEARRVSTN